MQRTASGQIGSCEYWSCAASVAFLQRKLGEVARRRAELLELLERLDDS